MLYYLSLFEAVAIFKVFENRSVPQFYGTISYYTTQRTVLDPECSRDRFREGGTAPLASSGRACKILPMLHNNPFATLFITLTLFPDYIELSLGTRLPML